MEKPILLNGFLRSGTSFLYLQMHKHWPNRVLYEPLNARLGVYIRSTIQQRADKSITVHKYFSKKQLETLYKPYYINFGEGIFDIIRDYHPCRDGTNHFIFRVSNLISYIKFFRNYHIKEVYLSLYLNNKYINKTWEVYHIFRHPIDTLVSMVSSSGVYKMKKFKLLRTPLRHILKFLGRYMDFKVDFYNMQTIAKEIVDTYGYGDGYDQFSLIDIFIIPWTIANYYAIKSLPEERIIIYNDVKTYKRLPFKIIDRVKIKEYPNARESLTYEFDKAAKRLNIESEYNYLMKFFE